MEARLAFFGTRATKEANELLGRLRAVSERSELLDEASGIGLWEAVLHDGDALHPESKWTWSAEFRRMVGYDNSKDFPNVVYSWSDRLHPDDVAATFAAFGKHLEDKTGRSRYCVDYRLKVRDGSYRWFRATGGCMHQPDGRTIRACGSLTDVHEQLLLQQKMAKDAEDDQVVTTALGEALLALADGDLSHRITAAFSPKAEALKENFNAAAGKLQEALRAVASAATGVQSASGEIGQAADDLARRTEQQAASLEETAAALDEITATVKKTAEGANELAIVATAARSEAESSGTVVEKATAAMAEIQQSSNQIGQIISVIDEIAFQTNLLALNAGVEAARAGEAGKGFAVVAQEVRELAQRAASAAKDIKTLITASSQQVEQGVDFVGKTGSALRGIVTQIKGIAQLVSGIASSTQEQSTGLHQINSAVNQMDQMTQQNAAMVEETSASSQTLTQEANELSRLISHFTTERGISVKDASRRKYAA
jgi:methyl-accepting chemotaxis protein